MKIEDFLIKMWKDYSELNPHIIKVLQLIKNKEPNKIINDHIALRTFNHKKINRHILSKYFIENGYKPIEDLFFTKKKLKATYYIHSDPSLPRIFISELLLESFSDSLQQIINKKIEEIDTELISNPIFLTSGIPWSPIDFETYKNVKGILINIFGGIMRCDVLAQGVVDAAKEINISVPLVVRLAGTNFKEGKEILDNSGLKLISAENLDDAAKKIVEAIK